MHKKNHLADQLFLQLKQIGIKQIFGIPGDELEIFDALGHSGIKFITTRHEQAAAFMAQAVGKVSRLPGVCISTLGPGATNLATGVADAHQNRSPVLVLSGQMPTQFHKSNPHAHQYIDLQSMFKPITKAVFKISNARSMQSVIEKAIQTSLSGRPGPVHVTLPVNIMEKEVTVKSNKRPINIKFKSPKTSIQEINRTIELLNKSKYPIAFFGQRALYAHKNFIKLLRRANIPVMTSFLGKGSFPEGDQISLGTISRHIKDSLVDLVKRADLFIIVDYDYIEGVNSAIFNNRKVIYIDSVSSKIDKQIKPSLELVGDVTGITQKLARKMLAKNYKTNWNVHLIKETHAKRYNQILSVQKFESFPINPYKIMQELQKVTTGNEVIVSDVGNHKQALALGYNVNKPMSVHFSNGLSSMGFSVPFCAGLRFAMPKNKKIISIVGDGGFLMNVQELETITRYNLDIKIIVYVDNAFGMIKANLLQKYKRVRNLDFTNPDFLYLAKSFGIKHLQVNSKKDLPIKLKSLVSTKGTTLLSIPVKYS